MRWKYVNIPFLEGNSATKLTTLRHSISGGQRPVICEIVSVGRFYAGIYTK